METFFKFLGFFWNECLFWSITWRLNYLNYAGKGKLLMIDLAVCEVFSSGRRQIMYLRKGDEYFTLFKRMQNVPIFLNEY